MKQLFSLLLLLITACSQGGGSGERANPYIVDPAVLPAYKTYIEPVVAHISSLEDGSSKDSPYFSSMRWQNFLKHKIWYIGPVDLPKISKDILGVSFSSDQTQQLAVQTDKQIWIQSDLYNQMSRRDQADLLIHEFVMSIYFLKYKSFTEFCQIANARGVSSEDCSFYKFLDEKYPSQKPVPLAPEDYQNIRRTVSFFIQKGTTATNEEIQKVLIENHFDPRLFSKRMDDDPQRPEYLTKDEIAATISDAPLLHRLPEKCHFLSLKRDQDCHFDFQIFPDGYSIKYNVKIFSIAELIMDYGFQNSGGYMVGEKNSFTQEKFYSLSIGSSGREGKAVIGSKARFNSLLYKKNPTPGGGKYLFDGFVSQAMSVTEIRNLSGRTMCIYSNVNANDPKDDTIIALTDSADLSYLQTSLGMQYVAADCD